MILTMTRSVEDPRITGWVDRHIHALTEQEKLVGQFGITVMPGETIEKLYPNAQAYADVFELDSSRYEQWRLYRENIPRVSYVRVEEAFRRKGIGIKLYIEGARWMAEYGLCLAASDRRNKESVALWDSMIARADIPTIILGCGSDAISFVES